MRAAGRFWHVALQPRRETRSSVFSPNIIANQTVPVYSRMETDSEHK